MWCFYKAWGKGWARCLARQLVQPFPLVCGGILVRNSPFEAVRKIWNMRAGSVLSEVMLEKRLVQLFIALCGPLSFYVGFVEVKERLEEPPFPYPPPSRTRSSRVLWVGHAILMDYRWIRLSQILAIAANEYQTRLMFSLRPARRISHQTFAAHERKRVSKLSLEVTLSSLVGSGGL